MIDLSIGFLLSYNEGSHINEDLLLVNNIADMPLPNEPGKVDCLFLGMCTSGIGKYTLNTVEYVLQPRDLLIVTQEMSQITMNGVQISRELVSLCLAISIER